MAHFTPPGQKQDPRNKPRIKGFASWPNAPSWEFADDVQFLEVTQGCTHNSCRFCTFYKNAPYRQVPFSDIEDALDYLELVDGAKPIRRIFLQAANAFSRSYDDLMAIAELIHNHLPRVQSIGGYGRITDLRGKSVQQLRQLHEAGYEHIFFGVESADDVVLGLMRKGYGSAELYEAGRKLHESGLPWESVFMLGLGGHGYGFDSARATAEFMNVAQPNVIGVVSLSLVYDEYTHREAPLMQDVRDGLFEPAYEIERYEEFRALVEGLECQTVVTCNHSTMPYGFTARLPEEKEKLLANLTRVIETGNEDEMRALRAQVKEV